MSIFLNLETWVSLLTLCFLEIVLGIDNIIFVSLVSSKLPKHLRSRATNYGLSAALVFRLFLLTLVNYLIHVTKPLFFVHDFCPNFLIDFFSLDANHGFSARDLILCFGGLFLITKSTQEINNEVYGGEKFFNKDEEMDDSPKKSSGKSLLSVISQIILIDIIFSFDSILTAVGVANDLLIMILAVIISILIMMRYAGSVSRFIERYPSLELLALGFLILIGFLLFLGAFGYEIPRGYIYFAVAFSMLMELINIRVRNKKNRHRFQKK